MTRTGTLALSSSDERPSFSSGFRSLIVFVASYVGTSIRLTYVEKGSFFGFGFFPYRKRVTCGNLVHNELKVINSGGVYKRDMESANILSLVRFYLRLTVIDEWDVSKAHNTDLRLCAIRDKTLDVLIQDSAVLSMKCWM